MLFLSDPGGAATCTVPGTHATIGFALADPTCATIELAAQSYVGSLHVARTVTLAGAPTGGSVLVGFLAATGASTVATISDLAVESGCTGEALRSTGGARVVASDVAVVRSALLPCPLEPLIVDGFESGNTNAWSSTMG